MEMPSPFPGMDPFLEDPALWPGVHQRLITNIGSFLNASLPPTYVADIGERLYVVQAERSVVPDVVVSQSGVIVGATSRRGSAAVATAGEPPWIVTIPPQEVREPFIEIVSLKPRRQVVTVIEVLSPANKAAGSADRDRYLAKQRQVLDSPASLVELDLLRRGAHTVAAAEAELRRRGDWEYLACVHRGSRRWDYEVWPLRLRERLPAIRIPLAEGEPDVRLDLQAVFDRCYDEGGYARMVDYDAEPAVTLEAEDAAWADALLREQGRRA